MENNIRSLHDTGIHVVTFFQRHLRSSGSFGILAAHSVFPDIYAHLPKPIEAMDDEMDWVTSIEFNFVTCFIGSWPRVYCRDSL